MSLEDWDKEEGKTEDAVSLKAMDRLVKDYVDLREAHEAAKKLASEAYNRREEAEQKVLQALKAVGKNKYLAETLGTFSIVYKEQVTTPKTIEAKQQVFDWISQKYGEDVLRNMVTINHQTLNSFYKQAKENAEDQSLFAIPGLEQPVVREEVRFTRRS